MICRDAAFGIQQDGESLLKAMEDNEAILDDLENKIQQSVDIANNVKKDVKQVSSIHVCGNNRNDVKTQINMIYLLSLSDRGRAGSRRAGDCGYLRAAG